MTAAQKLRLKARKLAREFREWLAGDDYDAAELETRQAAVSAAEERADALEAAEAAENGPDRVTEEDAEARELRQLRGRVEVRRYIGAAMEGGVVDGAEAEFNGALNMGAGSFPLRLLAPERRTTTDTEAGAMQGTWLDRLFAMTAAMRLGVSFRSVGPGVAAFPVTTAGASAAQRGRQEDAANAAWTVGVTEIKPSRNAVRAVFSVEDAARLRGLEDALRRDLRMALTEGVDRAIFKGDDGADENAADIVGLQTAAIGESTLTQANKIKGDKTLAVFAAMIDGKHAAAPGDLRIVATVGANTLWLSTLHNAAADSETVAGFLRRAGLSWSVRGEIEAATADGDFGAFVGLGRGINGAAVAPVWDAARLIRDPYSEAASGEIALTLQTLWGFKLPRPANFKRLKFAA